MSPSLKVMIQGLQKPLFDKADDSQAQLFKKNKPTIVMDAGIATEDNINWLKKSIIPTLSLAEKNTESF